MIRYLEQLQMGPIETTSGLASDMMDDYSPSYQRLGDAPGTEAEDRKQAYTYSLIAHTITISIVGRYLF